MIFDIFLCKGTPDKNNIDNIFDVKGKYKKKDKK